MQRHVTNSRGTSLSEEAPLVPGDFDDYSALDSAFDNVFGHVWNILQVNRLRNFGVELGWKEGANETPDPKPLVHRQLHAINTQKPHTTKNIGIDCRRNLRAACEKQSMTTAIRPLKHRESSSF